MVGIGVVLNIAAVMSLGELVLDPTAKRMGLVVASIQVAPIPEQTAELNMLGTRMTKICCQV